MKAMWLSSNEVISSRNTSKNQKKKKKKTPSTDFDVNFLKNYLF